MTTIINKKCPRCHRILEANKFYKNKGKKDGMSSWCKQCSKQYIKNKWDNDPEFRKKERTRHRIYENLPETKQKRKRYREDHKETIDARRKKWYHENKTRHRKAVKRWNENNRERYLMHVKKQNDKVQNDPILNYSHRLRRALRKARQRNGVMKQGKNFQTLGYTPKQLHEHLNKFEGKFCVECGSVIINKFNSHIDHIKPMCLAKNEQDIIRLNQLNNLRLICKECNLKKSSRDIKIKKEK